MSASVWTSKSALAPPLLDDPTVEFTTTDGFFDEINRTPGDIVIFTNVSPRDFDAIQRAREERRRKIRFRRYYCDDRILIVVIPTPIHEQLHAAFYLDLVSKIAQAGLNRDVKPIAATRYRARRGRGHGDEGEGDSAMGPIPGRLGHSKWPTLVIEAGYSESLSRLRDDMKWWFSASNHQVKIVVLAKFDRRRQHIHLEKWEEHQQAARPGAITTRSVGTLVPVNQQTITITRDATVNPPTYEVTRGALVLEFSLLFLRAPDANRGEADFVFSIDDLQHYARLVWSEEQ